MELKRYKRDKKGGRGFEPPTPSRLVLLLSVGKTGHNLYRWPAQSQNHCPQKCYIGYLGVGVPAEDSRPTFSVKS